MNNIVVRCESLKKSFDDGVVQADVLHGVDLTVSQSQSIAIVGSSGSGKSTLLHLLGGLDKPTHGNVRWYDHDVTKLSEKKKSRLRNEYLGFIYQFHHLLPEFSALENVAIPLLVRGCDVSECEERAKLLLEKVGLGPRLKHKVTQLSGGERQRVAIARAMVTKPHCIFADEPTGNLDLKTAESVLATMLQLQAEFNTSFVVVTHDPKLAQRMQVCYALQAGKLTEMTFE